MSIKSSKILVRSAALLGASAALAGTAVLAAVPASAATTGTASARPNMRPPGASFHWYSGCGEEFYVTGTYVNVRASYSTDSSVLAVARKGDEFSADYKTTFTSDGYFWAYGTYYTSNFRPINGYMAMSYLYDAGPVGCTSLQ